MNEQISLQEESPVPYTTSMTVVGCCISPLVILWFVYNFLRYDILIFLVLMMSFKSVPQAIWLEILLHFAAALVEAVLNAVIPRLLLRIPPVTSLQFSCSVGPKCYHLHFSQFIILLTTLVFSLSSPV